jgi:hypothetical protein
MFHGPAPGGSSRRDKGERREERGELGEAEKC